MRDVRVLLLCGMEMGVVLGFVACNVLVEHGAMSASPQVVLAAGPFVMIGAIFGSQAMRRIRLSQAK